MNTESFRKTALIFIFKNFDDDFKMFLHHLNSIIQTKSETNKIDFVLERFQKKVQMVPFTIWV